MAAPWVVTANTLPKPAATPNTPPSKTRRQPSALIVIFPPRRSNRSADARRAVIHAASRARPGRKRTLSMPVRKHGVERRVASPARHRADPDELRAAGAFVGPAGVQRGGLFGRADR